MAGFFRKNVVFFVYVVLALSTLLVFWQVNNFDFVNYDDSFYVYENPHVLNGLSGDSISWAFTTDFQGYWQPLTWLSLIINNQLLGSGPAGFHLVNVFLHLANTLLLFAVLRKMTGSLWQSAFVAAAFALHPMHVESVAWIAERKDVLSTLFLLLTLAVYIRYIKSIPVAGKGNSSKTGHRSLFLYLFTLLFFLLGLLSKPMLVTLPFLLLLLDFWPLGRFTPDQPRKSSPRKKKKIPPASGKRRLLSRVIIEKIPFFFLSAASSVITFLTQKTGGLVVETAEISFSERIINAFYSYATYIGKLCWPSDLAVNYPLNSDTVARVTPVHLLFYVLLLGGVSFLVILFRSKKKYLLVGWLWFLGTLVPVIGLIQFTGTAYADRFTYIPYIGLFIMIGWGVPDLLSKWRHKKIALMISAFVVLTALGIGAYWQTGFWKNGSTLFSHAIDVNPGNDFAYNNLGAAFEKNNRLQEAAKAYQQATRINPGFTEAYYNLGNVYSKLGYYQGAITAYQQAIKIKGDFADGYYNLGNAYLNLNRNREAVESFKQAIEIKPGFVDAYFNLGNAYLNLEANREAIDIYRRVLEITPDSEEIYANLGIAFHNLGRHQEAIEALEHAVRLKPDFPGAHINLGYFYLRAGDRDAALEEYKILKSLGVQQAEQLYDMINQ